MSPVYFCDDDDVNRLPAWQNEANELSRKIAGDELFERLSREQFQDAVDLDPGAGVLGGIGDKIKKTKYDLFSSTTLSQNGQQCFPRPVGGVGFAKVVSNPKFPEHDFFRASRIFCIRLRHNNMAFQDDAMLDGRVTSLKFCDSDQGGELDLIFATGRVPQFYNTASFEVFAAAFKKGPSDLRDWVFKKPINYFSRVEHVRRNPESYYDQRYYSHVTYMFTSRNGDRYVARLRLVPTDGRDETGRPDKADQESIWETRRWESETRQLDYLRAEYRRRLASTPLQYRLQLQLRPAAPANEPPDLFNACVTWDGCVWADLALVTVVLPLTEERLARTRVSLLTHPASSFSPAEPTASSHFNSMLLVLKEFHGVVANTERTVGKSADSRPAEVVHGTVSVTTGKQQNAGTDGDVYITITGVTGRTSPLNLTSSFHDDFEPGQTDMFGVEYGSVGALLTVHVELRSVMPNRQWYLETVTVAEDGSQHAGHLFPCYAWLTSNRPVVLLRKIDAVLPQDDHAIFTFIFRKYELVERRLAYPWAFPEGLPGRSAAARYEDLPREAQFSLQHELDTMGTYLRTLANTSAGTVRTLFDNWDALHDYPKLLTNVLKDRQVVYKVAAAWKSDEEFGRQFLNGTHPTRIRRLTTLPDMIGEGLLSRFMDRSVSVKDEMMAGHLYVVSYPELEGLDENITYKGKYSRYLVSPTCVLYVRRDSCLVPVAIRLHAAGPVWTPHDGPDDWLFAKMWVREADAQLHHIVSRHLHTHLTSEVFALAALRHLPAVHPVYKLVEPHLRHCVAANVLARRSLYPLDDGLFHKFLAVGDRYDTLLRTCYGRFHLSDLNVPVSMRARGVHDVHALPNYFYRDDALALWGVISKFVRVALTLHYWTPMNVQLDDELQAWVRDIHENGLRAVGAEKGGKGGKGEEGDKGVPTEFRDIAELTEFVTTIIFTASCQNAALTSGMMDYYAFCPNAPTMMLVAPPTVKGCTTMEVVRAAMPSRGKTAEVVAACYTLSRLNKDQVFLGDFDEMQFDSPAMRATIAAFQEDLRRIQRTVTERNTTLDFPYTYLMPDRIPKNISI